MSNCSMRRSKNPLADPKSTNVAFPPATIPSRRRKTANIHTASTTSIGVPIRKKSHSTSMALSTSQNRRRRKTPWRRRVSGCKDNAQRTYADQPAVRLMAELVSQVKDEQGYIVMRERIHRNTAESTNSRIKWWSIFQLMVLICQGVFQVWWLKRFFEVSGGAGLSPTACWRTDSSIRSSVLFRCGFFIPRSMCGVHLATVP